MLHISLKYKNALLSQKRIKQAGRSRATLEFSYNIYNNGWVGWGEKIPKSCSIICLGYLAWCIPVNILDAWNVNIFHLGLIIRGYRNRILSGTFDCRQRTCRHKFRLWRPGHILKFISIKQNAINCEPQLLYLKFTENLKLFL